MAITRRAMQPVATQGPAPKPAPAASMLPPPQGPARKLASAQVAPRGMAQPTQPELKKGIFDAVIQDIMKSPQYLTPENVIALRSVLPLETIALDPSQIDLSGLLQTLTKLHSRMQVLGVGSDDPAEIKNMISSTKTVIELVRKHQDAIGDQSRQIHLENAVVEALDELGSADLKARFLEIFGKKLKK